ncbi:MAG: hypothetical protein ABW122_00785 [Ilumatobacteraceae bacterium]
MEPLEYLPVLRRRWWIIVGLVVAAVAIVYAVTPGRLVDEYQATNVLLVEAVGDNSADANPQVVALWAKENEVLTRAAAEISSTMDPTRLDRDITARADRNVGTVAITATDINAERAALKANTVADATVAYLTEQETQRREAEQAELAADEADLRARISQLDATIGTFPPPPDVDTQTAERDALIRQLGTVLEAQDDTTATGVRYTTIDAPERGTKEQRFLGTRTRGQRMLVAAGVAAILGFGLALLLDRSDTRIRSRREAEEHFGLPVIAEVVKFPFWLRRARRRMVVDEQPDTAVSESYRTVRSALMLLDRAGARPPREPVEPGESGAGGAAEAAGPGSAGVDVQDWAEIIMIVSPDRGDGKTTTVGNVAAAFGESGRRVLMLNVDLQRRARRRGKHRRAPGITEYLASDGTIALDSLAFDTKVENVRAIGAGHAARPPGGQLEAQQRLLDEASRLADVVVVDTAPLLASSLNRELATMVDGVVVLCRIGKTTVAQAEKCAALLDQVGAPAVGVVLVGVAAPAGSAYFSYHSIRRERPSSPPRVVPAATAEAAAGPVADEAASAAPAVQVEHGTNGHAPTPEVVAAPGDESGPT